MEKAYDAAEFWSRDQIEATQAVRLKNVVTRVWNGSPFYRKRLEEAGVTPESIRSIADIERIPFTTKDDLRSQYPLNLVIVPHSKLVRLHCSSGTTGTPTAIAHTQNDLNVWADLMARCLHMVGVTKDDVFQNMSGYGLFTGGLGAHLGSKTLGCMTVPVGTGNTHRQAMLLQDFKPTFILCTPSYALTIAEYLETEGIGLDKLSLKKGFFGAEPWTEGMRKEIERRLGLEAFDIYGLSEAMGPGVSYECECHSGLHVNEDCFILEIINPDTGEPVPDGQMGEIVFTCIAKECLPLIRYRTHDIAMRIPGKCECGRTFIRMSKPVGRSDDMLIIRGVNVFPSQVESVLTTLEGVSPYYQLVVTREKNLDNLTVLVELTEESFTDEVRKLEEMRRDITSAIQSTLGIAVHVRLVSPHTIERFEGKAVRVIDKRTQVNY